MILTRKQLRKAIEKSLLPASMHKAAFDRITAGRRIMWETELFRLEKQREQRDDRCPETRHWNEDHAI